MGIVDNETHTAKKNLEVLQCKAVLTHQEISKGIPGSISQLLRDYPKLWKVSVQLTEEAKKRDLDVIVQARVVAVIGLLNIYTDEDLEYSWTKASEVVVKTQGAGVNHMRHIREWAIGFLKWGDLPLHQLNWKRATIVDDEDIAEELKMCMMEKGKEGFLKAQDIVDIIASPRMQEIFTRKNISKPSISIKTALRWLDKLGWMYGKLKNGMYIDGHERPDVVEYREQFIGR